MRSIGCLDPRTYRDFNVENGKFEHLSVKPVQNGLSIQCNQHVGSLIGDSFGSLLSSADKGYSFSVELFEAVSQSINPKVWITNPTGANYSYNSTGVAAGDSISGGYTYSQSPEQATSHNSVIFNKPSIMVDGVCSLSANYRSTKHDLIFPQTETCESKENERNDLIVIQSPTQPFRPCNSANDFNDVCSIFTAENRSIRCDLLSLAFSTPALEETCEQNARDIVMNSLTRPIYGCVIGISSKSEEYDSIRSKSCRFTPAIEQSCDLKDELEHVVVMQSLKYLLESNNHHIQFDDVQQAINSCSSDCEQVLINPSAPHFLQDTLHSFVCYRPTPVLQEYYRQESSDNLSI